MAESLATSETFFEPRDANPKKILYVAVGFVVVLLVLGGVLLLLQHVFSHGEFKEKGFTGYATGAPADPASFSRFESGEESRRLTQGQIETLHSYGWVDASKEHARIPIERAMKILAKKEAHHAPQ